MKASFKGITVFTKDIQLSTAFFSTALGLKVDYQSSIFAEIKDINGFTINLKQVDSESYCTAGYNPILNFQVEDLEEVEAKLLQYGANKDGKIKENEEFKIGSYRSPEGVMLSLLEVAEGVEGYLQNPGMNQGKNRDIGFEDEEEDDENIKEIKNILSQIKL